MKRSGSETPEAPHGKTETRDHLIPFKKREGDHLPPLIVKRSVARSCNEDIGFETSTDVRKVVYKP